MTGGGTMNRLLMLRPSWSAMPTASMIAPEDSVFSVSNTRRRPSGE
jgi:hypothetical protein